MWSFVGHIIIWPPSHLHRYMGILRKCSCFASIGYFPGWAHSARSRSSSSANHTGWPLLYTLLRWREGEHGEGQWKRLRDLSPPRCVSNLHFPVVLSALPGKYLSMIFCAIENTTIFTSSLAASACKAQLLQQTSVHSGWFRCFFSRTLSVTNK